MSVKEKNKKDGGHRGMTHDIFFKKSDTRVVMDEMEKNRGASREAEGTKKSCLFHSSHNNTVGDSRATLSACVLYH